MTSGNITPSLGTQLGLCSQPLTEPELPFTYQFTILIVLEPLLELFSSMTVTSPLPVLSTVEVITTEV